MQRVLPLVRRRSRKASCKRVVGCVLSEQVADNADDRARVQAAGKTGANRDIATQAEPDRIDQQRAELFKDLPLVCILAQRPRTHLPVAPDALYQRARVHLHRFAR